MTKRERELKQENHSLRTAIDAHQRVKANLLETITELRAKLAEFEASFELYDDAIRRGTKKWHEAGNPREVHPDTAKLVAWMVDELDRLEALAKAAKDYLIMEPHDFRTGTGVLKKQRLEHAFAVLGDGIVCSKAVGKPRWCECHGWQY